MADLISLTHTPVRALQTQTGAPWATGELRQPMFQAIDVGGYDYLDLQCYAPAIEGAVSCTIAIWTGTQGQMEDGWVQAAAFGTFNASAQQARISLGPGSSTSGNFLRYIRWDITGFTAGTAITFFIRGMGRALR